MATIQPFKKTTIQTAVRFSLDISQLILNTSATFRVSLYHADDKCIDNKYITIDGNDYKNWNSGDQYIIDFVLTNIYSSNIMVVIKNFFYHKYFLYLHLHLLFLLLLFITDSTY